MCARSSKYLVMLFGYTVSLDAFQGFPGGSDGKEPACPAGDWRSPGEGNGYPFQYSCLEILWREEPGGLLSVGWQRGGHY